MLHSNSAVKKHIILYIQDYTAMPKQAGSTHISTWLLAAGYHHGPGWEIPKLNASEMAVYLDTLDIN